MENMPQGGVRAAVCAVEVLKERPRRRCTQRHTGKRRRRCVREGSVGESVWRAGGGGCGWVSGGVDRWVVCA